MEEECPESKKGQWLKPKQKRLKLKENDSNSFFFFEKMIQNKASDLRDEGGQERGPLLGTDSN